MPTHWQDEPSTFAWITVQYRPEIDGLRAVAVLPVVLFHAGYEFFSGGYVGVDVFFVISGYLITGIILSDLEKEDFSLARFYERRARRILPALYLVVLASSVAAWCWMTPRDLQDYSASAAAVAIFLSNVQFWRESGYFDTDSELKPLLHTWSLSVEEQFYLLFPLAVIIGWRLGRRWLMAGMVIVAALSLTVAERRSVVNPDYAYYLLPTRAWELLIGAVAAAASLRPFETRPDLRRVLGFAGLLLIGLSVFFFDRDTRWPSVWTLAPTVGAVLVLRYVTPGTPAAMLLGWRPLVGAGLISYSLYLWHQPILAFARLRLLAPPSQLFMAGMMLATLALSYLTWRYVELPFRNKGAIPSLTRQRIFALSGAGAALIAALGTAGYASGGWPDRPLLQNLPPGYLSRSWIDWGPTTGVDGRTCITENGSLCQVKATPGAPSVLLIGDSHSADMNAPWRAFVAAHEVNAWQMSLPGCSFAESDHDAGRRERCSRAWRTVENFVSGQRIDVVVVINHLAGHFTSPEGKDDFGQYIRFLQGLGRVSGEVVVFGPRPTLNLHPVKAAVHGQLDLVRPVYLAESQQLAGALRAMHSEGTVRYYDQSTPLIHAGCGNAACFNGHDSLGLPLFRDTNHLTDTGARLVFQPLAETLDGTLAALAADGLSAD